MVGTVLVRGADFFVSPTGSATGDGSIGNSWDLFTAFGQPAAVKPGDTIWLRGGVYVPRESYWPSLECYIQGTADKPIIVRQFPGERVILQEHPQYNGVYGQTILYMESGGYVWFLGLEIRSTNATLHTSTNTLLPNSVDIKAPGVKLINLTIHDTRGGIGLETTALNAEVSGCVVYNNGYTAPDRGHGHGIYLKNLNGLMHVADNVIFNQFGLGVHGFTTDTYLKHFLVERNIVFNNSRIGEYPNSDVKQQVFFGADNGTPVTDLKLFNNCVYLPFDFNSTLIKLDYGAVSNDDVVVANNYIAGGSGWGGYAATSALQYQSVTFTNNLVYTTNGTMLQLNSKPSYVVDRNTYYGVGAQDFYNNGTQYGFANWKSATGFDANSTYLQNVAPPNKVFVLPNAYRPKRANIVVYNWGNSNSVSVNVSSVLATGDVFQVVNAQDPFAPPVLTGTFTGAALSLPMTNLTVEAPAGWANSPAVPTTGTKFNCFILTGTTPPQVTAHTCSAGGAVTLQFRGAVSNAIYTVEASSNLVTWTALGVASNAPPGSATYQFVDSAGNSAGRFYRVRAPF